MDSCRRFFCRQERDASHELDVEAASILAALSLRIVQGKRPTSGSLKESDGLSIDVLSGTACISAWQGLTRPAGGFGSRAFLRYPQIDYQLKVSGSFKRTVVLEIFVHEARQRNCSRPEDKGLAPLAFTLHEKFVPKSSYFPMVANKAREIVNCRLSVTELYLRFTRFMIRSMANLDILSRTNWDFMRNGESKQVQLPSWELPFQDVETTSLVDDLLFTQYHAANHLGAYCETEGSKS